MLAIPQGFTLSVAGTAAATIGQRGYFGFLDIWLFVVGASLVMCVVAFALQAHTVRPLEDNPVSGWAFLNASAVVAVPIAHALSCWIGYRPVAFAAAGAAAVLAYVSVLAVVLRIARD